MEGKVSRVQSAKMCLTVSLTVASFTYWLTAKVQFGDFLLSRRLKFD